MDLKLSHFLYVLQIDELRWVLMDAQAWAATFQASFFGLILLVDSLIQFDIWFTFILMIIIICIELAFLRWSFSAARSLSGNPFFINHIIITARKESIKRGGANRKAEQETVISGQKSFDTKEQLFTIEEEHESALIRSTNEAKGDLVFMEENDYTVGVPEVIVDSVSDALTDGGRTEQLNAKG